MPAYQNSVQTSPSSAGLGNESSDQPKTFIQCTGTCTCHHCLAPPRLQYAGMAPWVLTRLSCAHEQQGQLVHHLDCSSSNRQQLLVKRDMFLVLLMWKLPLHGDVCSKVSIENFLTLKGQPILAPTGQLSNALPVQPQLSLRLNEIRNTICPGISC